jgi:hypothetical protein|tara:strand:- start:1719 stop:1901 length:183 start_codon:yes stop_codon:yes gene_type:complete
MQKTYVEAINWQTLGLVANLIEKLQAEALTKDPDDSDIQKDFMLIVRGMKIVADEFLEAE